jgi:hypothetical protein
MVPEGIVRAQWDQGGWFVEIGRSHGTKRFRLSAAEASQLVDQLRTHRLAEDVPQCTRMDENLPQPLRR